MPRRQLAILTLAAVALGGTTGLAGATSLLTNVQANRPQVSGDPGSDVTARFPTNKQNETTIALNPLAPDRLISGANDEQRQPPCGPGPVRGAAAPANDCSFFPNVGTSGVYTSGDGGLTWTNRGLLDDQSSWASQPIGTRLVSDGDPVIAYGPRPDAAGRFSWANGARAYYATLAAQYDNVGKYPAGKAPEYFAVSYSDDDGATWSAPVIAVSKNNPNNFNDKEWITVDTSATSRFFGRVYVSWTQFRSSGNGNDPVQVAYSPDGGRTFSTPKQLSPAYNNAQKVGRQGTSPAVGPDGSAYVAYEQGYYHVVNISRDGGVSWTRPIPMVRVADIPDPVPGANFRTDSFPSLAADPRPGATTLYLTWADRTANGGRMLVSTSTDRGLTWGAPVTVSTAAEGYAFEGNLAVAPNGRIDLAYQAVVATNPNTFGTGNATIDAWYVAKPAGGTWSAPRKVSTASSDPAASAQNNLARQFWGDYNQVAATNDRVWFAVTDSRNGVGCAAVDAYQRALVGTALAQLDDEDPAAESKKPSPGPTPTKPAPGTDCFGQFGNTDAFVSVLQP